MRGMIICVNYLCTKPHPRSFHHDAYQVLVESIRTVLYNRRAWLGLADLSNMDHTTCITSSLPIYSSEKAHAASVQINEKLMRPIDGVSLLVAGSPDVAPQFCSGVIRFARVSSLGTLLLAASPVRPMSLCMILTYT